MPTPPFVRTPDDRFANLAGYPFAPHYAEVNGLRMHYLDEGTARDGTMLLLHGEPSWSFLYRNHIAIYVEAGYRCIAPDMVGFGRSDKVTDPAWYSLDAHIGQLRGVIEQLDLRDITIVCQDWAGPYGLCNVVDMPERFRRLIILNTWLHHDGYEYTPGLYAWNERAPSVDFSNMGPLFAMPSQDPPDVLQAGYRAPFFSTESQVGAFRWPWMLPFKNPREGGADRQARAYAALATWDRPAHVIFGEADHIFTPAWGETFAAHIPGATFDVVPGSHFVQETGRRLAELILRRIAEET